MSTDAKIRSEKEAKSPAEANEKRDASCERELNLTTQEPPGAKPKPEPQPEPGRILDDQTAEEFWTLRDSIHTWVDLVLADRLAQGDTFIRRFYHPVKTFLPFVVSCLLKSLIFADSHPIGFTASQKAEIANIDNDSLLSGEDKEKNKAKKLIEYIHSPFSEETGNSILNRYENICEHISPRLLDQHTFAKYEHYFKRFIFGPAIALHTLMRCSPSRYRVAPPQATERLTDGSPRSVKTQHNGITEVSRWAINNASVASHWLHLELNYIYILFQPPESDYVEVPELSDDGESSYSDEGSSGDLEEDDSGSCYDGVSEPEDDGLLEPSNNGAGKDSNEKACNPKNDQVCETRDGIHEVSSTGEGRPGREEDRKLHLIRTRDGSSLRCEWRETARAGKTRPSKVPGLRLVDDGFVESRIQDLPSRGELKTASS
ncbi:hypothetical protein EMPG_12126 [Blastomyces silverae]|uniref:Uncharacterized protein n=1 Tax=Blastomyces silverae TaxID=2060906 RepID=A0A0H1BNJ6_9EURO|nr:hypothetical protein EMPG_12126 [Blastomyces silverae]